MRREHWFRLVSSRKAEVVVLMAVAFLAPTDVIEMKEGHRPRVGEMVRLTSDVEEMFGRDVDLLAGPLTPELRGRIDRDVVTLYDAGG